MLWANHWDRNTKQGALQHSYCGDGGICTRRFARCPGALNSFGGHNELHSPKTAIMSHRLDHQCVSKTRPLVQDRPLDQLTGATNNAFDQHFSFGSEGGTRTRDTTIMSRVLDQEPQDSNPVPENPENTSASGQTEPPPITEI